jgi:hypothetical protein
MSALLEIPELKALLDLTNEEVARAAECGCLAHKARHARAASAMRKLFEAMKSELSNAGVTVAVQQVRTDGDLTSKTTEIFH